MPYRVRHPEQRRRYAPGALPRRSQPGGLLPRKGMLVAIVIAGLCAGIGFGGLRLYNSQWLTIQQVRVEGNSAVDEESVRQAAALSGDRFLTVDTAAAAARVMALPRVKSASVVRNFPNSATIQITERTPIGVWRVGATSYLVAGDGLVIDATDDDAGLPVVDATQAGVDVQAGDRVDADALRTASTVAQSSPPTPGQSVVRFVYDKQTGLTAITAAGTQVRLGDGQSLDYKLAVWQQLALKINPADLHEIDLRYSGRPFYR